MALKRNDKTYASVVCMHFTEAVGVADAHQDMVARQLTMDVVAYSAAISACEKSSRWQDLGSVSKFTSCIP